MFHIHGVVIDNTTSLPAAGVTVRAYYHGGCPNLGGPCNPDRTISTAVSGSDGRYALDFTLENGLCPPFSVDAIGFKTTEADYGGTPQCDGQGQQMELTIYIK